MSNGSYWDGGYTGTTSRLFSGDGDVVTSNPAPSETSPENNQTVPLLEGINKPSSDTETTPPENPVVPNSNYTTPVIEGPDSNATQTQRNLTTPGTFTTSTGSSTSTSPQVVSTSPTSPVSSSTTTNGTGGPVVTTGEGDTITSNRTTPTTPEGGYETTNKGYETSPQSQVQEQNSIGPGEKKSGGGGGGSSGGGSSGGSKSNGGSKGGGAPKKTAPHTSGLKSLLNSITKGLGVAAGNALGKSTNKRPASNHANLVKQNKRNKNGGSGAVTTSPVLTRSDALLAVGGVVVILTLYFSLRK